MSKAADSSEPASEVERLIADLSASGELIFVFGDGLTTAHLTGTTTPEFRGPADRRWWHVTLGDDAASWTMSVRVDEITGVRFVRHPCQNGRTATAMRSRFLVLESRSRLPRHWRPSGSPVASWPKLTTNGRSPTCATCPKAPWHSWPRGLPTRRR